MASTVPLPNYRPVSERCTRTHARARTRGRKALVPPSQAGHRYSVHALLTLKFTAQSIMLWLTHGMTKGLAANPC